jgi:3-methyladenine DNA glycosylase AlkD
MTKEDILGELKRLGNRTKRNLEGMARFGIRPKTEIYCVSIPKIRKLAKSIGKNNDLALELWNTNVHEARILAGLIAEPNKATNKQLEKWVSDFDSWDICDLVCSNYIDKTKFAVKKIPVWAKRKEEFVKRTAFTLMATLSVHDKNAKNEEFLKFFPIIKSGATDERNFVKKAVNWAIRQIGKRNMELRSEAIKLSKEILKIESKSAKWISRGALNELNNQKIIVLIKRKNL